MGVENLERCNVNVMISGLKLLFVGVCSVRRYGVYHWYVRTVSIYTIYLYIPFVSSEYRVKFVVEATWYQYLPVRQLPVRYVFGVVSRQLSSFFW